MTNSLQAHRLSWFEGPKPKYKSINFDNPTAGRTAYFGYVPRAEKKKAKGADPAKAEKRQGAKSGTFTIRIYDKGIEVRDSFGRAALAHLDDEQIQDYARIECSAAPGTAEEKRAMARNLAKSNAAAWGFRAFSQQFFEILCQETVERIEKGIDPIKSPDERLKAHFERFHRFYCEHFDGESVMKLLHALVEHCGVRMDVFAPGAQAPQHDDPRSADYLAMINYADHEAYDGAEYRKVQEWREREAQAAANLQLVAMPQASTTWQERARKENDRAIDEALHEHFIAEQFDQDLRDKKLRFEQSVEAGEMAYVEAAAADLEALTGKRLNVFGHILERSLSATAHELDHLRACCEKLCPDREAALLLNREEGALALLWLCEDEELFDKLTRKNGKEPVDA
ncbi:hypothetical protein [Tropicibacter alexandrii]|uniref:hypothetical protein n=1 Tax=Tropicibacter alexandrii TaxID=2267683 RepID=UPI000EF537B2|nr:hypothetical protein [Tropicibacter alexandrii]